MNSTLIRSILGVVGVFSLVAFCRAEDATELFSKTEAAKLLGQPVVDVSVVGPEKDDESPAQGTHWIYRAADSAVVVTRMTFSNSAEAQKFTTPEFVKLQMDESESKVFPESGVGEKSFWTVSAEGAAWTFLKGNHIGSVGMGGRKGGPPESHKAALKMAAIALAAKL